MAREGQGYPCCRHDMMMGHWNRRFKIEQESVESDRYSRIALQQADNLKMLTLDSNQKENWLLIVREVEKDLRFLELSGKYPTIRISSCLVLSFFWQNISARNRSGGFHSMPGKYLFCKTLLRFVGLLPTSVQIWLSLSWIKKISPLKLTF